MALPSDPARAADVIRKYSTRDAARWAPFVGAPRTSSPDSSASCISSPAPDIDTTAFGDVMSMLGLGRKFRALGRADMTELLRVMPMSIQDLLDDEFESESLKAAIAPAASATFGRDLARAVRRSCCSIISSARASGSVRARPWWRDGAGRARRFASRQLRGGTVPTIRTGARRDDDHRERRRGVRSRARERRRDRGDAGDLDGRSDADARSEWSIPCGSTRTSCSLLRNIKYRGCTAYVLYALESLPGASANGLGADELASVVSLTPSLSALERAYDAAKYGANLGRATRRDQRADAPLVGARTQRKACAGQRACSTFHMSLQMADGMAIACERSVTRSPESSTAHCPDSTRWFAIA